MSHWVAKSQDFIILALYNLNLIYLKIMSQTRLKAFSRQVIIIPNIKFDFLNCNSIYLVWLASGYVIPIFFTFCC